MQPTFITFTNWEGISLHKKVAGFPHFLGCPHFWVSYQRITVYYTRALCMVPYVSECGALGCNQKCVKTGDGNQYQCACHAGYRLQDDNKICVENGKLFII